MKNSSKFINKTRPLILIILDGWGIAPPAKGNAIFLAKTPTIDALSKKYPYAELCAHGECVGLSKYQDGNSEAGHMNIGAGRVAFQDVVKISQSINEGVFFKNAAFLQAAKHVKKNKSNLHLMGLLSNGMSAHSDPLHLLALLDFTRRQKIKHVYLHLFTDGRDSPQHAAFKLVEQLESKLRENEKIATIMGRYYGMDRKKSWRLTEQAYDVLTDPKYAEYFVNNPIEAISESYNRQNTDEFIEPYLIKEKGRALPRIKSNDAIIFFNLRSDRARQISKAFVQKKFEEMNPGSFKRKKVLKNLLFAAMTDFGPDLDGILTAFPGVDIKETLPMRLKGMRQFYIAETEKYAHMTYFFNGGYADPVGGEKRILIPSPNVKSYEEKPEMSSKELTRIILKNIKRKFFDFMAVNYACPDMIGHTGNLPAGIAAVEALDKYIAKITKAAYKKDVRLIITADHGNIEEMINLKTGEVDTEHSTNPVPFILFGRDFKNNTILLAKKGVLGDIAPTILKLLNKEKPKEMTGNSLL